VHTIPWLENLKGTDYLEDLGIDGKILKWILGKYGGNCGLDAYGSGLGPVVGSCEHSHESSGSTNGSEFDWVAISFSKILCSTELVS